MALGPVHLGRWKTGDGWMLIDRLGWHTHKETETGLEHGTHTRGGEGRQEGHRELQTLPGQPV